MNLFYKITKRIIPRSILNIIAIKIDKHNNVQIAFNRFENEIIKDWYLYCVQLITTHAKISSQRFNIIFGDHDVNFNNNNRTFRVILQFEHTLVKEGGRDSMNAITGTIPIDSSENFYLTRLVDKEKLEASDIIIDYSRANLINVKKSNYNFTLSHKYFYITPLLYQEKSNQASTRSLDCITMFGDPKSGRRKKFIDSFVGGLAIVNKRGVYRNVWKLYQQVKILINIHQTDHHCTAEELRIIPAAINGAVVLSEKSPLLNSSYTKDFAIWGTLDELPKKADEILQNYDDFRRRHFNKKFQRRLNRLKVYNDLVAIKIIRILENRVLQCI